MLTFGSLFSGIGGLDLGLERAGMKCMWQSEIEPYACKVLAKHWPDIPNLGDIREIDWSTVPRTDVICGGYPCQPFSVVGSRNGADDPRHLWPMFARAISVVRPRYALLENVTGHLSLGFGQVLADLAALGYDAEWDCIPAAAIGAPHLRDRVFIIATQSNLGDPNDSRSRTSRHGIERKRTQSVEIGCWPRLGNRFSRSSEIVADTDSARQQKQHTATVTTQPRQHPRCGDALWRYWETEPNVGRVADGIPHRVDRLRGLGNAVVPQVAEHIGNIINNMEETQ